MCRLVKIQSGKSYDVYIGRGSIYGNIYSHIKTGKTRAEFIVATRKEAIQKYREYLLNSPELLEKIEELRDKTLACFCVESEEYKDGDKIVCHGQIIQRLLKEGIPKLF